MMRTWLAISAVLMSQCMIVAATPADPPVDATVARGAQPEAVIDHLLAAIAQRDLSATMDCFSSGQDIAVLGSELEARARGRGGGSIFRQGLRASERVPLCSAVARADDAWRHGLDSCGRNRDRPGGYG
jgi:hypothetical protein